MPRDICEQHVEIATQIAVTKETLRSIESKMEDIKDDIGKIFDLIRAEHNCVVEKTGTNREKIGFLEGHTYAKLAGAGVAGAGLLELVVWLVKLVQSTR